ncbi:CcdB family protein [Kosakonia sp. SOY2]|uniref:CcdB family protein n=1 Tax=Kosakonia sp. SOY2 TaxID=3014557 RepID=UPI0022ABD55E|nr:CcdB family protein [Kosakonia sp. SOY2]MCZ3383539.1 CcdB family protein [Kosakonia sp. SOY2]
MQYSVYRNKSNSRDFPFLLDVQSDIIGSMNSRVVIPLCPLADYKDRRRVERLNPVLEIEGNSYLLLTHDLAGVSLAILGEEVCSMRAQREVIRNAMDFIFHGI